MVIVIKQTRFKKETGFLIVKIIIIAISFQSTQKPE